VRVRRTGMICESAWILDAVAILRDVRVDVRRSATQQTFFAFSLGPTAATSP